MAARERARSPAVEDYCKAIFTLESRTEEPVATNPLAERLGITPGSVSAMLKRLGELGLIEHHPYRGVRLTEEGRRVALEVIRHHRLIELFLAEALEMPWDRVHAEAEVLEHVISEELEQLIAAKLGDPTLDPHGDPIPSAELELHEPETHAARAPRRRATRACSCACPTPIRRCSAICQSAASRRATACSVRERQPFGGPLLVALRRRRTLREHAIGGRLARRDARAARSRAGSRARRARAASGSSRGRRAATRRRGGAGREEVSA